MAQRIGAQCNTDGQICGSRAARCLSPITRRSLLQKLALVITNHTSWRPVSNTCPTLRGDHAPTTSLGKCSAAVAQKQARALSPACQGPAATAHANLHGGGHSIGWAPSSSRRVRQKHWDCVDTSGKGIQGQRENWDTRPLGGRIHGRPCREGGTSVLYKRAPQPGEGPSLTPR